MCVYDDDDAKHGIGSRAVAHTAYFYIDVLHI